MPSIHVIIFAYLVLISLTAIILTCHDKTAAKRRSRRVSERTLLLISVLGGSLAMFLTMLSIRHKTKHLKFMVGIPVIIVIQVAIILLAMHWF
ncbi:MAG: DUF1294 domain-containing protein [Oscillospiraceae bacterium]|nr:DUF1294 domain-containing protein [Oscillospiraceae bacterium]